MTQEIVSDRQAVAAAGGQQVGVCVLLERDEGQLPDADEGARGQVSGIICIINMHLLHIFDKGELGSFDNRKLTTPLQSHCCFYMYKTACS